MKRAVATMGAAMVVFATAAAAQEKSNFAGKWVLDAEKSQLPAAAGGGGGAGRGGMGGGMRGPFTITVDGSTLTREAEGPQGAIKTVYKLDGSETEIQMGPMTAKAKARWEGGTLVIETSRQGRDGNMVTTRQLWKVEGENLVIENETPNGVMKMYYKKA